MEQRFDPLVDRWRDLVRPRVIRSHRRVKGRQRTVVVATLALATATVTAAVVGEGWPYRTTRPPLPGAPPTAGAVAAPPATTTAGQGAQAGPTATASATPAATTPPPPTPAPSPTPRPAAPRTSPTIAGRGAASTPTRTTPPPRAFVPLRIEAEAPTNVVAGGAAPVSCASCSGGTRIGYIGATASLVVIADLPTSGQRTIRVTYETDGPREIRIKANGVPVETRWLDGDGWESPRSFTFTTTLPAGVLQLTFYNDQSPSPDIDQVTIS